MWFSSKNILSLITQKIEINHYALNLFHKNADFWFYQKKSCMQSQYMKTYFV